MYFSDILDVHNNCRPKGFHRDILGDGFLLESNPIYRKIKTQAVKIGAKYIEAYPDYLLMPFQELPVILKHKKIPYVPSARLIKKIEQSRPGVFSTDDMPIPESYHLHESSHVVAEYYLKKISLRSPQDLILKTILAESFANTVDALVCTFASDDIHWFFVKQNSYMHPQKKIIKAMNELTEALGCQFTFMLTFFTYVHANFLASPLSNKAVQELVSRYAQVKKINLKHQKNIRTVCQIGEDLDPLFRYQTTANYFKQMGFDEEVESLLYFKFMDIFDCQTGWRKALESLSATLNLT